MCLGEHYSLYLKHVFWNFNIILWSMELYQSCAANLPDCLSYAWYCQHICWCSVWCLDSRAAKDTWGNALLWLILVQGAYSYSSNHHGNVSLSQLPQQQLLEPPAKWRGIYLVKYHNWEKGIMFYEIEESSFCKWEGGRQFAVDITGYYIGNSIITWFTRTESA